jgi:hypothetical protein
MSRQNLATQIANVAAKVNAPASNVTPIMPPAAPVAVAPGLAELMAALAAVKAENAALKATKATTSRLSLKVSEKGALSVYGLGRFPVSLYREQWERLLGVSEDIKAFIVANSASLKVKGDVAK